MMTIKQRINARRQAIAKFKREKPLILASNCMGGRDSQTWGVRNIQPEWQIKKPVARAMVTSNKNSIDLEKFLQE